MDTHILMAERRRITDEFRTRLTCLGILRTQLSDALTDEARQYLYVAVDEEMALCRGLGDKLLQLDASIQVMQRREVAAHEAQRLSITVQNAAQSPPNESVDPRSCTVPALGNPHRPQASSAAKFGLDQYLLR